MKAVAVYVIQAITVLAIAFIALRLWNYDLTVPFQYGGDSIVILMYIKGLLQDGWPTVITQLSAPFSYSGAAFPILTSFDWLIMKGISLFTNEPGLIINLFWLSSLVFSAFSASYAGYQLGLTRFFSFVVGVLYAFLPYALLRNVAHLNLVYYLVPLLCLLAVVIFTKGESIRNQRHSIIIGLSACLLQGFNYIYFSFFAVLIFAVAAVLGWQNRKGYRQLGLPSLAIFIVSIATAANLSLHFRSISENGPPPDMGYKYTAEAEIYGAKFRKMIAPHPGNKISPVASYAQKDIQAGFPNENENGTARLGLFGAAGLVLSMLILLRRRQAESFSLPVFSLASLSFATFLVIAVGGIGAVINLLTVPDIRAYNRFSVFLSFFSISVLALWAQNRLGNISKQRAKYFRVVVVLFALFSLYDQLLDRDGLLASQQSDMKRAGEERGIVDALERALPPGSAVLQLPFTGFPPLEKFHDMESYDHARAYLWSGTLKWSWPSFSQRHRAWQSGISEKNGIELINSAILSGFQAIWIDRAAYANGGEELISELNQGKVKTISLPCERVVVLDLREEAAALRSSMTTKEFDRLAAEVLGPEVAIDWEPGFYGEEKSDDGLPFRWSQDQSKMTIRNLGDHDSAVCLKFVAASPSLGSLSLVVGDSVTNVAVDTLGKRITLPISIPARDAKRVVFGVDVARLKAEGDPRNLYFFVKDYRVDSINNSSECSNSGG